MNALNFEYSGTSLIWAVWYLPLSVSIGNSGNGNRKWKMEMENRNSQNLMQMNLRVKPLIKDYLLKTTSVKDHIAIRFQKMAKIYLMITLLILP